MTSSVPGSDRIHRLSELCLDLHRAAREEMLVHLEDNAPEVGDSIRFLLDKFPISLVDVVADLLEAVADRTGDSSLLWRIRVARFDPRTPEEASDILREFSEEVLTRFSIEPVVDRSLSLLEEEGVLGERNLRRLLRFFQVLYRTGASGLVFDGGYFGVRDEWFGLREIQDIAESYRNHDASWGQKAVEKVFTSE